ncbi:MBOAT family protein-like protein [Westerdykella ornata]|uniref:MBOAT family protein-like protein n=1 Tax=Westerdykella ornata TaxID=318751 RepID=A0A6A6J7A6_WESOR|nr:MBOAT family protein-like protein [Westerdykella ornata]KAF2272275.1 MBOAT family protein-like protein [Westerdykella ornata]
MLPYINTPFVHVGKLLGTSPDDLKLVFSFYLSYPLAAILKRIPDRDPWKKNLFIICVSVFYLVGLFDLWDGFRTLIISATGAYMISWRIKSPYMPWVGFVFLMAHMSINHIYRQLLDDDSVVDITGAQMVMIMKLTAFCWNVQDGRLPDSELSDFQKAHAIRELPGILDYAGYVLFFPALMAGPAFDYCDYSRYISTTMFALPPGVDPSKAPPTRKKRKIPRSGTPATIKALVGSLWIFSFLKFSGWYNTTYLLSDEFTKYGFLRRVWCLYMLGFTTRMKYYGVWTLTEGACILSGIGYNGIDAVTGRAKWDRLTNIKPLELELAQNTRGFLGAWNINTNNWLRNYMYLRVTPKGKKPGFRATLATFFTSAFWHGFYPGYYLSFILAAFIQTVAKNGRRLIRPLFLTPDGKAPLPSKQYYDIATFFITQATFAFTVAPFIFLRLHDSLAIWSRVYYYGVVGTALSFALFDGSLPFRAWLIKRQKARTGTAQTTAKTADEADTSLESKKIEKVAREAAQESLAKEDARDTKLRKKGSMESLRTGMLGIPDDPAKEMEDIVAEVKRDIEERKRRGSLVQGFDVRRAVDEKVKQLRSR